MGPVRFSQTAVTKLDVNGNGQVGLGPPGADWVVMTTTVATSTAVKQPIANTYVGAVSQGTLLDGTYSGAGDTSDTRYLLTAGEQVIATWTGGDAGAQASLRVAGLAWPAGQGPGNL